MKTERLRAHLGLGEVNETSDSLKQKLEDGRREQAMTSYDTTHDIFNELMKIYKRTGKFDQNLNTVREFMGNKATRLMASVGKVRNRRNGLKGDGSPRTPKQESAFNFINGLKRLSETSDPLKQKLEAAANVKSGKIVKTGTSTNAEEDKIPWTHTHIKATRKSSITDKFGKRDSTIKPFESVKSLQINRPRNVPQSPIE